MAKKQCERRKPKPIAEQQTDDKPPHRLDVTMQHYLALIQALPRPKLAPPAELAKAGGQLPITLSRWVR